MGTTPSRYSWLGAVVAVGAVLLVVSPIVVQRQQAAHAEQIRSRCVQELSAKGSWRARIDETEVGSDGKKQVTHQELLVRTPGEYRLTLRERAANGDEVVSTTIRTKSSLYTHRTLDDGSTELHVVRGIHPSLGVELDNLLGETVRAVATAQPLKVAGRGTRNGREADKLELGPGHYVWVDEATGLPVEEQVVAEGRVSHAVTIRDFDDRPSISEADFEPSSLGAADTTTVEDLGFRLVSAAQQAASAVGFIPLDVPEPAGFSADVRGYTDPSVTTDDAPAEGSFVDAFIRGPEGVLVTQVSRPGSGDSFVPTDPDDGSFERVTVAGTPAAIFRDGARHWLVFARRDVLITIEGDLTEAAMTQLAERIR